MEEILASIRRIIADEKDPATAAAIVPEEDASKEDVLELTQMVQDDGSVVDVSAEVAFEEPAPSPTTADAMDFDPVPVTLPSAPDESLMSHDAANAATSSLAALASTVQIERRAAFEGHTLIGEGGRTLEDIVMALMRPMLKEWLDQNLPPVVERIVQKEVEHIARRATE
jgi:hypothetical protein